MYPGSDGVPEAPKAGPLDWLVDKVRGTTKGVRIQGVDGLMLGGGRGSSGDFDSESGGRSRAPAAAGAKTGAAGSGGDFEDFPGALEETDDDLPF